MLSRSLAAIRAAFLSPTALVAWLLSAALFAGSVALLGPIDGALVGAILSKATYALSIIAAFLAFGRKI